MLFSYLKSISVLLILCATIAFSQTPTPLTLSSGRIAISHDGNNWDKDDVFSLAMDWAVVASFGMQKKLVHVEHSVIKCSDSAYYPEIKESAKGWKYFPGFDSTDVFDAWINVEARVAHFKAEAEKSSANDRLYFILAGPMEIAWQDINAVSQEKRQFITVLSHSQADETMGSCVTPSHKWADLKMSFPMVQFVQIPDPSSLIGGVGGSAWNFLLTMPNNSLIPDAAWKWLKTRDFKANGDCSDTRMLWYVLTGKTTVTALDYQLRFTNPLPMSQETTRIIGSTLGAYSLQSKSAALTYSRHAGSLPVCASGRRVSKKFLIK